MYKLLKGYSGFTLIELLVTITVASILMGIAIPSFNSIIQSNRLTTRANELVSALNFARSEAIKRNLRISLCKSSAGIVCTTSNDWSQGWIIFTDDNNNSIYDSTDTLLKVQSNLANTITMVADTTIANSISYLTTGLINQIGTIKICDERKGNVGIVLDINSVGRVSTTTKQLCT